MQETIKDIFTSKQEYSTNNLDRFNRVLSYSINRDDFFKPVVSEALIRNGFNPVYPNGKKFAVVLSHDIDLLYINKSKEQAIKNSFKGIIKKDYKLFSNSLKSIRRNTIWPECQVENILEIEKKYGAKSTFFFIAVDKNNSAYNYNISEQKEILKLIKDTGNEVGLHGSYIAYNNYEQLISEKNRLEDACGYELKGYRNHNLNFDIKTTWSILEKAGFEYDATYGLADRVGFRNGMCHPFKPYDLMNKRYYDLVEFPLHIMDVSMFNYMNLSYEQSFEMFKRIVDQVEINKGVLSFLWHNTRFSGDNLVFYQQCLQYLTDGNAYFYTYQELDKYFKEKNYYKSIKKLGVIK